MCERDVSVSVCESVNSVDYSLHYQPLFTPSGEIVAMEALLRGSGVFDGLSPDEFVPLLESNGAILTIGELVIKKACMQRRYLQLNGLCKESFYISVNVSPLQLEQEDFVQNFVGIVFETGLLPHQISIEITEGALIKDVVDISQKISQLRTYGFLISIDDFGMGYSSLAYLKHFSIDVIKIDRFFVKDIGVSRNGEVICRGIIDLAKNLGIKTVAEGVETLDQIQFLEKHGCEIYQGFYFSKPLSAARVNSFLHRNMN